MSKDDEVFTQSEKRLEVFVKRDFQSRGEDVGGVIFEADALKYREAVRKVSLACSKRSLWAMEPVVHEHMEYFVERMKEFRSRDGGVGILQWTNWLAIDLSTDLSWNKKTSQVKTLKDSVHLEAILAFNPFATVI
ncbi:predicted protein [Sclerotinia sclerotiorum 1980 UF-70]|uniref:Uncharacterized protein n=1 Tax=Sclerotinia sclerotiorum (strain ATCC 18683 / 1980 / Ss-1) TaxID=665079 RepID=A7ETV8_SCLS1|nr:predicted protein [Sclerotinia sclerotiorum 1980 UF-70]EDN92900.1 predicted protein [Sclerotinia sclerotiorum 1980 UF-70]